MSEIDESKYKGNHILDMALSLLGHLKYSSPGLAYILDENVRHYVDKLWRYGQYIVHLAGPETSIPLHLAYNVMHGAAELYDVAVDTIKGKRKRKLENVSKALRSTRELKKVLATA